MAEKEQIEIEIILDGKKYKTDVKKIGKENKKAFDSKNADALNKTLKTMALRAGALATAYLSTKVAIESVFDFDRLKSAEQQFDILSKKAGVAGDSLKEGMLAAADGLIETQRVLELTNESMVAFGSEAKRLPQLMKLAQKASIVSGKSFEETYRGLSEAIKSGSAEALAQYGIIADSESTLRKYARQVGATVSSLSQQAKVTATLNVALEKGKIAYAGIDTGVTKNIDTAKDLANAFKDLKASIGGIIDSKFGKWLRETATAAADYARILAKQNTRKLAADAGDLSAKLQIANLELGELNEKLSEQGRKKLQALISPREIKQMEERKKFLVIETAHLQKKVLLEQKARDLAGISEGDDPSPIDPTRVLADEARLNESILQLKRAQLAELSKLANTEVQVQDLVNKQIEQLELDKQGAIKKIKADAFKNAEEGTAQHQERLFEIEELHKLKIVTLELDASAKIRQIRSQRIDQVIANTTDEEELDKAFNARKIIAKQETQAKITALEEQFNFHIDELKFMTELSDQERRARTLEAELGFAEAKRQLYEDMEKKITDLVAAESAARSALIDREVLRAEDGFDAFYKGLTASSKKAMDEVTTAAKLGAVASQSFGNHMQSAFEKAGQAGFVFGNEMKKAILNTIADIAAAQGRTWLIMGLINPLYFAAGAALMALSGALRAAAGGGGGGGGAVASSGAPADTLRPVEEDEAAPVEEEQKKKSVTIQILGNYFETDETRERLVEMIRESGDFTDFKVQSVGGGL